MREERLHIASADLLLNETVEISSDIRLFARWFIHHFGNPPDYEFPPINDIAFRVLRGKTPDDFQSFTSDPGRKFIFLSSRPTADKLLGKDVPEMLRIIRNTEEEIEKYTHDNTHFMLFLAPYSALEPLLFEATWNNLFHLAYEYADNDEEKTIVSSYNDYASTHMEEFCKPREEIGDTFLAKIRDYYYKVAKANDHFAHDEWMKSQGLENGDGITELIMPNMDIIDISGHLLIPLPPTYLQNQLFQAK